jgi:hypothetical protein
MAKKFTVKSNDVMMTTPVRNAAIPKMPAKPGLQVTQEMIAKRAYEIYRSGKGGSEMDNWLRAERELRNQ